MTFPFRYLSIMSAVVAGSLLLATCGGEEEPLWSTPTPVTGTPAASTDPQDFAQFADFVARAVAEQDTSFFAARVQGRAYTCAESDVGGESSGIEQGLCQEAGQQIDVVEHGFWRSGGLLGRPNSMATAIEGYFGSALPGESDDYGTGAVRLYAIGTTRSSDPSRAYKAAILTAITPVDGGATAKPVRTARGINFQYVDGRWVIRGMLWANVLGEELLSADTAPYDEWARY